MNSGTGQVGSEDCAALRSEEECLGSVSGRTKPGYGSEWATGMLGKRVLGGVPLGNV